MSNFAKTANPAPSLNGTVCECLMCLKEQIRLQLESQLSFDRRPVSLSLLGGAVVYNTRTHTHPFMLRQVMVLRMLKDRKPWQSEL